MTTNVDYDAILKATIGGYMSTVTEQMLRPNLIDDLFLSPEAKAERKRLDKIGPRHGPYTWEVDWTKKRGRITTYYKGRVRGMFNPSRRTDCDCL